MAEEWREFEIAVAKFVQSLDPSAKVIHDAKLPSKHTGRKRQRDVWVEYKLFGHFPVRMLISCKRHTRKLSEEDIDAFHGQILSAGAHLGVLYTRKGFTEPALEFARKLEICCCRLYQNEPADMPDVLILRAYCMTPQMGIDLLEPQSRHPTIGTWSEFLNSEFTTRDGTKKGIDLIMEAFWEVEEFALKSISPQQTIPLPHVNEMSLSGEQIGPIRIKIKIDWKFYRAKIEAHFVAGSYSFTSGEFKGSIATPGINLQGTNPGPGWELMNSRPSTIEPNHILCIPTKPRDTEPLLSHLGDRPFGAVGMGAPT